MVFLCTQNTIIKRAFCDLPSANKEDDYPSLLDDPCTIGPRPGKCLFKLNSFYHVDPLDSPRLEGLGIVNENMCFGDLDCWYKGLAGLIVVRAQTSACRTGKPRGWAPILAYLQIFRQKSDLKAARKVPTDDKPALPILKSDLMDFLSGVTMGLKCWRHLQMVAQTKHSYGWRK